MNVYGYDSKAGLKHACLVNALVAYTIPETGQVVILSINHANEIKGIHHHLFCLVQYWNGVLIDEVPKFLAPIPSESMHAIKIENPFDETHSIIIPLKLSIVTSYFEVRKPNQQEYKDQNIHNIELMMEGPPWDSSRHE